MSSNKKYDNLIRNLARVNPELKKRNEVIRNVMESTAPDKPGIRFISYLFGWTEYPLVRKSAIALSVIVVSVFMFQQVVIMNRIGNLEDRMVQSNTEQLLKHHENNVMINSALLMSGEQSESIDSILVADKDLRILVNSYLRLQKQNQDLQDYYLGSRKGKL